MSGRVLHIDGDSFFASCEVSLDHRLRDKPVVTGQERGIATAMTKEAKALGISRGMPIFRIKELFPQAVIRPSDYTTYQIFSRRMFSVVRRHAEAVEEYSIDECFARLPSSARSRVGQARLPRGAGEDLVRRIKEELQSELGMTFSLGLASTKVLAKLSSSHKKPDGLTVLGESDVEDLLRETRVGKVWGIGPATARMLESEGVATAYDLSLVPDAWATDKLSKPILEIRAELCGRQVFGVRADPSDPQKSIQATRSFQSTADASKVSSELSKNIEEAMRRARAHGVVPTKMYCFAKTREYRYERFEVSLDTPTTSPAELTGRTTEALRAVLRPGALYKATGVTLAGFVPPARVQESLFGHTASGDKWQEVFKAVDRLDRRYGSHTLALGSSLGAFRARGGLGVHKRLRLLSLGDVR